MKLSVWLNKAFDGHWPVGTSAVIVAASKAEAASLLEAELARIGLSQRVDPQTMTELCVDSPCALVLQDGNY